MTWFDAVIGVLAVSRLTLLVCADDFPFGAIRQALGFESWLGRLIHCPWCSSMYLAAGWLILWVAAQQAAILHGSWQAASILLSWSVVAGLLADWAWPVESR